MKLLLMILEFGVGLVLLVLQSAVFLAITTIALVLRLLLAVMWRRTRRTR